MYYKFSAMANRLIASNIMQAYHPQGLLPLSKVQITPIQMTYKPVTVNQMEGIPLPTETLPPGPELGERASSTSAAAAKPSKRLAPDGLPYGPFSPKLAAQQKFFQKKDGLPIHLKGGPIDYIVYYTIMGGLGLTVSFSLYVFFQMSFPKKDD